MKRVIKAIFPILLAIAIVLSIGWYLFRYDTDFTRNFLLQQARRLENQGYRNAAVWMYNFTYEQFGNSDEIILELVQHYIDSNDYSRAENTLRKAIEKNGSVKLYTALSNTYLQQGKIRDAVLMLDNADPQILQELASLRPGTPSASIPSGSYNQYLPVEIICDGYKIYVSTDGDYPSALSDTYAGPITLDDGETTIFAVSVAENGLVSSLAVFNYFVSDVIQSVTFTDPAFAAAVREQLGYGDDQMIYSNELWKVTELNIPADVGGIADLVWFPNLQKLVIDGGSLSGHEALLHLTDLQSLTITHTIAESEALACVGALTTLQELTLSDCAISTVQALAGLVNLQRLDLSDNAIRDISGLASMTQLKHLNMHNNALIKLDSIADLTALEYLDVSYNSLVSSAPIARLTSLQYFDASSNALRVLEGFENLENLTELRATYNQLLDVDALANCTNLRILDVSHNTLLNINVTAKLPALEELYFSHNEVTQLPKYSTKSVLKIIEGSYNQLSSLKYLAGLANIELIYMNYNKDISGVNSLSTCPALKEVHVYGTKVTSVSRLTEMGILVVYSPR